MIKQNKAIKSYRRGTKENDHNDRWKKNRKEDGVRNQKGRGSNLKGRS